MAFDDNTRTRLREFVSAARTLLTAECIRQLQHEYGMNPATGEVVELSRLPPLDDTRWETARLLRDTLAHYLATSPSGGRTEALQRIVREQAFTVLNRLVALRMMEARGLLFESIARGYQSRGFQLYQRLAGASLGETGEAYRCYLVSLFDEFALDLAVLFDRFSPQGRLFPREAALLALLHLLNYPDIEALWAEDETIGWIYQYYNAPEERRQMRADSSAPRNSRELAVRNQFFTPRYVVEFLTDNTLGRLWYEMTQGRTALTAQCRYLVRRPQEIFLQPEEESPAQIEPHNELSQEELLQQPVYIPFRALKDPRDIRMLDPACGSMHFGLYAFDLFEIIYDEAWDIAHSSDAAQQSSLSFVSFVVQYSDKAAFLADVPRLIIEHNLHGIDIDPRAVQIAGLSLWLRAQRTWQQQGLRPQERPHICRSHIVCAEPMPGEEAFLDEFIEAHLAATPEHKLLGQLVRRVFDAMKLAGEAGSLLKIEEEIAGTVAEAKQKWFADTKQVRLFADDIALSAQNERGLTVTGITDETFWEKAEECIYVALQTYAEQAEHGGYQRRLFADDAARGFAFIDVCRKRYDVALMNPPFGEAALFSLGYLTTRYPRTKHDVYAAFVERGLLKLASGGLLGAITSRTGFFLSTFQKWREEILLTEARPALLADLGASVLDSAMVETAAYILEKVIRNPKTICFRVLYDVDKSNVLTRLTSSVGRGDLERQAFLVDSDEFRQVPGSPFAYWVGRGVRRLFTEVAPFEINGRKASGGIGTTDDFRFIRCWWEILPAYFVSSRDRALVENAFVPIAQGGRNAPFYAPIMSVVNYSYDGYELKTFIASKMGSASRNIRAQDLYFRAGLTWPLRGSVFSAQVVPSGSLFSVAGKIATTPYPDELPLMLGLFNSQPFDILIGFFAGKVGGVQYEAGLIGKIPFLYDQSGRIAILAQRAWAEKRTLDTIVTTSHAFLVPALLAVPGAALAHRTTAWSARVRASEAIVAVIKAEIDDLAFRLYGLDDTDRAALTATLATAATEATGDAEADEEEEGDVSTAEAPALTADLLAYILGAAFGRWDIQYAAGEKPAPELPDPFAPLPVCPPGQLQNEHGLPITREDVTRLKEEDRWHYPLEIPWDGILVDNPGHPLDLEARVNQMLQIIWKDRWEAIEREACEILGVRTLRDYFRKPTGFFANHLKRYSKSRRQAPIYWPLQTLSGSYTLWLYYHRLNEQTLYTCVNDFVENSKLREVTEQLHTLRTKTDRSKEEEKKLDRLLDFEQELKDFRDELLRVAKFWKPNLNDGVQITAAPLWKLFQHKPWQKTLKETWDKLEKGDYDWAHLAYSIWPDRVRDKCRHDKSLAIAHEREDLYEAPLEQPRKKRGRKRG